jgi:TolA-binding protein
LSQTLDKGDSLYYETLFFVCECNIINENFDEAEMKLIKMYNDKITPKAVYEKVLVRLGQIYCYKNDIKTAKKYFQKVKKEFPNSIYLPFANCDFVR